MTASPIHLWPPEGYVAPDAGYDWRCQRSSCGHQWRSMKPDGNPPTWCAKCRSAVWWKVGSGRVAVDKGGDRNGVNRKAKPKRKRGGRKRGEKPVGSNLPRPPIDYRNIPPPPSMRGRDRAKVKDGDGEGSDDGNDNNVDQNGQHELEGRM